MPNSKKTGRHEPTEQAMAERPMQWFLLRGLARESGHWGRFGADLVERLPRAELHMLDLPGAGQHYNMRAPLSIEENARFAMGQFAALRKPELPTFILATSLGAMVVVDWLRQDDRHVDGVVLVNTSFRSCSPLWKRLLPEAYSHLLRAIREPNDHRRESHVLALISNRPEIREGTARAWAEIHRERPIRRETFARQLFAAGRFEGRIEAPPVPALLLSSSSDRMVHASCSDAIAERWRCALRRHPTAGHDLTLDAGPWAAKAIAEWLNEISS